MSARYGVTKIAAAFVIAITMVVGATDAGAISKKTRDGLIKDARTATKNKTIGPKVEKAAIAAAYAAWAAEIVAPLLKVVGQVEINDQFPVTEFAAGTTVTLTFDFINPDTLELTGGPAVDSVLYKVNIDPETDIFMTIGTSSSAASHFSIPYTLGFDEPFFTATPFDAFGNPIFIAGVDDFNDAIGSVVNINAVPEPSTLALFCIGALGILSYCRRRRGRSSSGLTAVVFARWLPDALWSIRQN